MIGYVASYTYRYVVGETCKVKGLPKVESSYGYKVYYSMDDALRFNIIPDTKVYEIEVLGAIDKDCFGKYVFTNKIRVVKELTNDELFESDYIYAKLLSYVQNMDRPGLHKYIGEIVRSSMDYALVPIIYGFTGTKYFNIFEHSVHDLTRIFVATYGTRTNRWCLINDDSCRVRKAIATFGDNSHREYLIDDADTDVRVEIAIHGDDKLRTMLLDDDDWNVCIEIIKHGNDKHREYYLKENNKATTDFILFYCGERLKRKIEKLRLKGELK